ncbi:glycosyltransferase family 4 protein [Variovorax boronicumulans]|uniref:glycosyltransferase family 4 protein n=1 Tax=Variovorax boronicumulans TaxID=436515 RepID=UPI0012E4BE4C|nr:glycosyltransferase family 4 protein [Variovorax boronicumulans]GER12846.1 glycosyltransferase family 1 protein [Variovorax boronicumulans]
MKILYIITRSDALGGASVHLLDLAEGMVALGHEVLILVGGNGVFVELAERKGLAVQSLKFLVREISPFYDFQAIREILRIFEDFSPDIVHLHSSKAGVLGRIAARLKKVPAIFTAHGWAFTDGVPRWERKIYRIIEAALAKITKRIITVSNYDRDLALRQGVGDSKLLVAIPNGVRDVQFPAAEQSVDEIVKLIMVARFEEPKDHSLLLRALAKIKDQPWSIEMVGDGPLELGCRELVEELGLTGRVIFSGFCRDVDRRIAASDVLILISKWEGLPLTIIEAMRGGLPVVASNVGGIPELVVDQVTGFLVERGDEVKIIESLKAALHDRERRISMGRAARIHYEENFSFEIMQGRTMAIYQSVIDEVRL